MYNKPLAYFITFTTRGSWLHGDARGSYTKAPRFVPPNKNWVQLESESLADPPLLFTSEQRTAVDQAIREQCAKRGWKLHTVNVRTNHVHLVVAAADVGPERVMEDVKAKATRVLRKKGMISAERKPWTEHGSTIYLFTQACFDNACHYVRDCQ